MKTGPPSYGTDASREAKSIGYRSEGYNFALPELTRPPPRAEVGLLRRSLACFGVITLFAFAVTSANYRRLDEEQLDAAPSEMTFAQTPSVEVSVATLSVTAKNEYGEYSPVALALYGLEMVVEPYRATTLITKSTLAVGDSDHRSGVDAKPESPSAFHWEVVEMGVDENGLPMDVGNEAIFVERAGGAQVSLSFTKPGAVLQLTVEERLRSDLEAVIARATITVSCKYVRRELRELTKADLKDFLEAMKVYFSVSTADGRVKYGEDFFNYELLTAYHDADLNTFCYHAGVQFLTAHAAFNIMMERSLQMINPKVSLPYWDYMIDADTMGADWVNSFIFHDDMFGRALGSPDNNFQVTGGRFANISTIFDPDYTVLGNGMTLNYHINAYNKLSPVFDYQELPYLSRTSSFCGLKSHIELATSDVFFDCFDTHTDLHAWENCMEKKVHGDIHGALGGAFHCNVDMRQFHERYPEYTVGLLTFALQYITTKYWPTNQFMPDYNTCDDECERGQVAKCGCTCNVDAETLSEDEIYSLATVYLEQATHRYAGDDYISYDETRERPWGFKQNGERLDDDATLFLLRTIVKLGCEPAAVGTMAGGISPMDPLFWVLHQLFEKGMHVLWLSPKYRDSYDFGWTDGSCKGSSLSDFLPFSEKTLGMGDDTSLLTNEDLMSVLHPSNLRLPFVYEKFDKWGTSTWDFCPECFAAVATAAAPDASSTPPSNL